MSWFLIFERENVTRTPGHVAVSGGPAGAGTVQRGRWRTFKPLMVLEADSAERALYAAGQATGRISEFFAVEVDKIFTDVLPPEMPEGLG